MCVERTKKPLKAHTMKVFGNSEASVIVTYAFLLLSAILFIFGVGHCLAHSYHVSLYCDHDTCTYHKHRRADSKITFAREDWTASERVHVHPEDANNIFAWEEEHVNYMTSHNFFEKPGKWWHSLELILQKSSVNPQPHKLLFLDADLGAYQSTNEMHRMRMYIEHHLDRLSVVHHHSITALGLTCVIISILMAITVAFTGVFNDAEARRLKKKA